MAATELKHRGPRSRWLPRKLWITWLYAYGAIWGVTLGVAAIVVGVGPSLERPVRALLSASLSPQRNAPPQVGHVFALAAHNIPLAAWPLLLVGVDAHRHRLRRHVADGLLLACALVSGSLVGAGLGAYGRSMLPYIPQLPLEWGGLAVGACGWLLQRRTALSRREASCVFALTVALLVCAAVVETIAVPHR